MIKLSADDMPNESLLSTIRKTILMSLWIRRAVMGTGKEWQNMNGIANTKIYPRKNLFSPIFIFLHLLI